MKAMIFAAGLGSRLKPWTDHHPKALAVVNGKSLLQRNVEYLQKHNISEVIVNVHHFADQVVDTIKKNNGWGSEVTISDETDEVLETGGGLKKAAWYFENTTDFAVMNADILTDMDLSAMIAQHRQLLPLATLAVSHRDTSRYFLFDEQNILSGGVM
jgi:MurNAc alpha-1-phosphate uridylyltransferase